ncbi:MAG: hypothetical protein ACR2KZ_01485 [Segetibacter sp.]
MRILLAVTLLFSLSKNICGQQTKSYVVKAGEQILDVLPLEAIYAFSDFKSGTVFMRDGSISTAKLNYNVLLNEMQFIGSKGDTMAIAYPETIKYISVDTLLYFYDKTYLQVVSQVDSFKVAIKQSFTQAPYRTRGGYDAPTATSSITTYSSITSNGTRGNLQVKKDVKLEKETSYFISDKFNHFSKADKKAFLNIFPMKKVNIVDYMNKNNVNFSNKDDIEKLLKFCLY